MSEPKKIKPSLSKGTRDFLPNEVAKRNYIFDTIKSVFRKYGFEQIETPAIEKLETLTGKYGEEGDKLLFKILNSGDYLQEIRNKKLEIQNVDAKEITPLISEKGLRYDLTVPLARYVVQHQDNLAFPFRRFHIGPVWRADRPQKGRYQEFYQCDADIIGSNSLLNEVELSLIYAEVFQKLGIDVIIRLNNRKFLYGLAEVCSAGDHFELFTSIIDKIDKIGISEVRHELNNRVEFEHREVGTMYLDMMLGHSKDNFTSSIEYFKKVLGDKSKIGIEGLDEMVNVFDYLNGTQTLHPLYKFVFTIDFVRGLNYYSGTIWEVILDSTSTNAKVTMGSLGGGGRYDNLTEMFGGQNMSGVGISFGIERIYDVMEELGLFPPTIAQGVRVLFVPRDEAMQNFTFEQVQMLRDSGIAAEIFLGNVKKQKHFDYVTSKNIAYLVEVGEDEQKSGRFRLRNTQTRETLNDLSVLQLAELLK